MTSKSAANRTPQQVPEVSAQEIITGVWLIGSEALLRTLGANVIETGGRSSMTVNFCPIGEVPSMAEIQTGIGAIRPNAQTECWFPSHRVGGVVLMELRGRP